MRKRKNLTLSPVMLERAAAVMKARGFDELSDFVAALIREEYERRHAPVLYDKPAGAPQPPTAPAHYNQPAPSSPTAPAQAELEARNAFELAALAAGAPGPNQSTSGPQPPAPQATKKPNVKRSPRAKAKNA